MGKHSGDILQQLESAVERSAGNHVEGDIGITVVDPVGAGAPSNHWEHRLRLDLRRLSRCRPRHGCQPNVRRQTPAAGVYPQSACPSTGRAKRFLTVRETSMRRLMFKTSPATFLP